MAAQNMVSAPERSNSFSTPASGDGPTSGASIKGFGGGSTPSQVLGDSAGKAPKMVGTGVQGFTNGGLISGKI